MKSFAVVFHLVILALNVKRGSANELQVKGEARYLPRLKGIDLKGRMRRFGEDSRTEAIVVVFLSTQCPISNSYLPLLNRLSAQYGVKGAELYCFGSTGIGILCARG